MMDALKREARLWKLGFKEYNSHLKALRWPWKFNNLELIPQWYCIYPLWEYSDLIWIFLMPHVQHFKMLQLQCEEQTKNSF